MSVYTSVAPEQLEVWLHGYQLGELLDLKGIASGITNTNYFVTTTSGRYVLTLFEHHGATELPYFLNLMAYLAGHDIPCPRPVLDDAAGYLGELNGKPAALVSCLRGASVEVPTAHHCMQVGSVLARMHLVGASYPAVMENTRGPRWWVTTAAQVMPFLDAAGCDLLEDELAYQAKFRGLDLPRGVIHSDLFRDNVLFDGDELGGLIDFYYACNDVLAYDLAIAANDWCIYADGSLDEVRTRAMAAAYHDVRPFSAGEREAWPILLRAAALRFWLSRLQDFHFPQAGELTYAKDPTHFQRVLEARIREGDDLRRLWE